MLKQIRFDVGLSLLPARRLRVSSHLSHLAVVASLLQCGTMVLAGIARGDPCLPSNGSSYASAGVAGGQQLGCNHFVVVGGGGGGVVVHYHSSCPAPAGRDPNTWSFYDQVLATYADGSGIPGFGGSGPLYGDGKSGVGDGSVGIGVYFRPGHTSETINWVAEMNCGNGMQPSPETIGSGSCTLCLGATTADATGRNYIKRKEGDCKKIGKKKICGLAALLEYNDPAPQANCTIGWGHLIHLGHCECRNPKAATCTNRGEERFYKGITAAKAQELFDKDLKDVVKHVNKLSPVPVSRCQMNALADFFFNFGTGRARINRDLRKGDFISVYGDVTAYYKYPDADRQHRDGELLFSANCEQC